MIHRGSRNLFSNLLIEEDDNVLTIARSIGRDQRLLQKRDECLVHRHYFYLKVKGLQYQDILSCLQNEFFLAEYTIVERLQMEDNYRLLRRLIKEEMPARDLRRQFPFLIWD